ncbi:M48 family metallopeptidase [Leptospira idonii]|uniref:M48 family peptidase n=1 Tax=Leptospira idonii TaxID=1193500 RepID=A0A4R9M4P0_9LEPT|nr:SprT family zinc-dependent metalloprotease [Leptospira idonii]TGN19708.1 M48 family peptidase [Leptospira idonii]
MKKTIVYPGLDIPCELREIRSKNISLTIYPNNRIIIRHPKRVTKSFIFDFLEERKQWVKQQFEKNKKENPKKIEFETNENFPIFGKQRTLRWSKEEESHLTALSLVLSEKRIKSPKGREKYAKDFLKTLLEDFVKPIIQEKTRFIGTKKYEYRIRTMRSLWGSCSYDNKLTFNLGLIHCPENVIRYVVAHEVSHTKEHNHSNRFWDLVNTLDPNYEAAEEWIKQNGRKVLCYLN